MADLKSIKIYSLMRWDGGDGRSNTPSGYLTYNGAVATRWANLNVGQDFLLISGVLINSIADIKEAKDELDRHKALERLSPREKYLLGLS
jgi:hypothetical protein